MPSQYQPPYRLFVNEGGEQEFSLTSTYVPAGKSNLAAFVSVNADATDDGYGAMRVLQLPNEQTPGPGQVANEMATDQDVRDALLEFSAGGSDVRTNYGNLLTLPVGDGLMYVQPVYASRGSSEASFPELQFVIVSYGDNVGIGRTMEEALADVLGVAPGTPTTPGPEGPPAGEGGPDEGGGQNQPDSLNAQISQKLAQAQAAFEAADAAQAAGNTVKWARELEKAKALVNEAFDLAAQRDARAGGGPGR
jgi:uncharacterized membrane protein (UPF0182 family)